ncbi:MAG TPA: zinc ribbon domain-containing protein, partial [Pyrinomonadaceae bacterium]|nr:zinc ribbon domain-containing protein [Pyrinomonadaceae bacterium]
MNCPNCGAVLPAGAQFCGACGTRVGAQTNVGSAPLPSSPTGFQQPPPSGAGFNQATSGRGINIDTDGTGQGRGYSYEILHQPSYSLAVLQLQPE